MYSKDEDSVDDRRKEKFKNLGGNFEKLRGRGDEGCRYYGG
jgi:hypothetical protein